MKRRSFSKTLAGAQRGKASGRRANLDTVEAPFKISVMLWTVLTELPFEERLEKVAEAGYHAVELVGEYAKWTENDFRRYNKETRRVGHHL